MTTRNVNAVRMTGGTEAEIKTSECDDHEDGLTLHFGVYRGTSHITGFLNVDAARRLRVILEDFTRHAILHKQGEWDHVNQKGR